MAVSPAKTMTTAAAWAAPASQVLAQAADPSSWPVGAPPAPAAADGARQTEQLRTELQQQEAMVSLLRQRLAEAETANILLPWLLVLLLGLAALSVWLLVRLRQAQRAGSRRRSAPMGTGLGSSLPPPLQADMHPNGASLSRDAAAMAAVGVAAAPGSTRAGAGAMASGADFAAKFPHQAPPAAPSPGAAASDPAAVTGPQQRTGAEARAQGGGGQHAGPPDTTLAGAMLLRSNDDSRTVAMGRSAVGELTQSQPVRPVSVEELLDLEQQVDFFLVLGQEEAAVDLLVGHIRDTGGTSALPFLKLMEVYRVQDNSEGYERIRQRFNQRFNAHAPEWGAPFDAGNDLAQYEDVMQRLQQMWPRPLDALAELETLLHRRSASVMFDLPAYRELMLLHALSRDLNEQAPVSAIKVDVLLPLGDEPMDTTSPRPHLAGSRSEAQALLDEWASGAEPQTQRSTPHARSSGGKLDLDLTEYAPAPREFTRPAAFTDLEMRRDDWRSDMAALDDGPPSPSSRP